MTSPFEEPCRIGMNSNNPNSTRVRRNGVIPHFVTAERETRRRYPRQIIVPHGGESATLRYRLSRWHWVGEREGGVRKREAFGWLYLEGKPVAAINLFDFDVMLGLSNPEFLGIMHVEEDIESRLALTLISHWEDFTEDVASEGHLVDFRSAWSHPASCPPGLWAKAASLLLEQEFQRRSILTINAFPLEYEGRVSEGQSDSDLLRRRGAMCRYYQRLFGVVPFPGPAAADGWLYWITRSAVAPLSVPTDEDDAL